MGKLEEKALRYDGIFFNDNLVPIRSQVINNAPTKLNGGVIELFERNGVPEYKDEEKRRLYNQEYQDYMIFNPKGNKEANQKKQEFFRKRPDLNVDDGYELFVSDHFGVMTTFSFKPVGGSKKLKTRRKRRRSKKTCKTRRL